MKKVLFVINTLGRAGAETALLSLLRLMDPKKYQISLYVLTNQGELVHELPGHVQLLNKRYSDSSVLSKEGKRALQSQVLRAMFSKGSALRRFPYVLRNFFGMLVKGRILPDKLLWGIMSDGGQQLHEYYDLAVAYLEGGSAYYVVDHVKADRKAAFIHVDYERAGYTRLLDRDCYLKFDKVFTVSDEVKDSFLKVYPECSSMTEVFHNIIDQERIREMSGQLGGFQDQFDGCRILTVGRLTAQKAYEVSIDAMKLLKERGVRARWYVLGEGEQRDFLEERIKTLGLEEDFLLLGAVNNPYPYMKQADLYVHASRFEGKSIAIQEAQTLGKPILVSDCSGNREQVEDGVDGIVCCLTPEGICSGILELLGDQKKSQLLGAAAAAKRTADSSELNKLLSMM